VPLCPFYSTDDHDLRSACGPTIHITVGGGFSLSVNAGAVFASVSANDNSSVSVNGGQIGKAGSRPLVPPLRTL
jgi:hypothetical protein